MLTAREINACLDPPTPPHRDSANLSGISSHPNRMGTACASCAKTTPTHRTREVWSHHRGGNAANQAKKRQLHGLLCKPTCHVSSSEAIRGVLARWPKHSQTFKSPGPTTANFQNNDHKLRPSTRAKEFRVSAFFSLPGCLESHHHECARRRRAIAVQRTHHGGVNGHLGPSTHGQTVDHHLQSASIQSIRCWDVHVTDHQICGHSSAHDVFESTSSPTKHSRLRTCCSMVDGHIGNCVQREGGLGEGDEDSACQRTHWEAELQTWWGGVCGQAICPTCPAGRCTPPGCAPQPKVTQQQRHLVWVDLHASTKTPPQTCVMPPTKVFGSFSLNNHEDYKSATSGAPWTFSRTNAGWPKGVPSTFMPCCETGTSDPPPHRRCH